MAKQFSYNTADFERKLARVMERIGADKYQVDWNSTKADTTVFVEMRYKGSTYRFENSKAKSRLCGRNYDNIADLLGSIVYSLEGLARAVEQGIFTLDMLLAGVPALPTVSNIEPCFRALGFSQRPKSADEVKAKYRAFVKVLHPDAGGSAEQFEQLTRDYAECLKLLSTEGGSTE